MARLWLPTGPILGEDLGLEVFADSSGMQVKVRTGKGWVQGHYYETDATLTKSIAAADPTNPRDDRVVLRADFVNNLCEIAVLTGTPNASPTPPALTQSTSKWEVSLGKVRVDAAVGTIAANKVTDERQLVVLYNEIAKRKAANQDVISSTVLQDDNDLFFYAMPNEAWLLDFAIFATGATAGDLKLSIDAPSGATGAWGVIAAQSATTGVEMASFTHAVLAFGDANAANVGVITATANLIVLKGTVANGANPGRIGLRWAQAASNAVGTRLHLGSHLVAKRIA